MAKKRMFSLSIIDTDAFMDMPASSQLLYFHLAMRADDEGFVSSPRKIMRSIGSSDDDYRVLISKKFIIQFESGICVIKHWLIHNSIRMDRFGGTTYIKEKGQLLIKENNSYKLVNVEDGEINDSQVSLFTSKEDENEIKKISAVVSKVATPYEMSKLFFDSVDEQSRVITEMSVKFNASQLSVKNEITRFVSYWSELNKSGTKQRWQMEKTFEIPRRLATWFSRSNHFSDSIGGKITAI